MKNKIITLTKIMFKNDETMNAMLNTSDKKKSFFNSKIMKALFFIGLLAIVAFSMTIFTIDIYKDLKIFNLQSLIPKLAFPGASLFVFIFGIFYVMNIFYFSDDIENYLYLPVKPGDIITSKFFTSLIYEYVIIGMLFIPILITYGYLSSAGILYYTMLVLAFVLLPILPIALAAILSILVMRFSKGAKNKDRFNLVAGIFALILAIGINFGIQFIANKAATNSGAGLNDLGELPIINVINTLFPSSFFATGALLNNSTFKGLIFIVILIAISVLSIIIFNVIGNRFYFDGVVGIQESGAKRDLISNKQLTKSVKSKNRIFSYSLKELRVLLRTPVFFLNNILMSFIFPLFLLVPFAIGANKMDSLEFQEILLALREIDKSAILLIFIALTFFLGSNNGIAATSISREGKGFYFMKYIPMAYIEQIYSKILVALFIQFIPITFIFIIAAFVFKLDFFFIIISFILLILASLFQNQVSIIFDIMWPKLDWDTEQKAVKQNLNFVFQMFLGFILAGVTIFILLMVKPTYLVTILASLVGFGLLTSIMHFILIKVSKFKFKFY